MGRLRTPVVAALLASCVFSVLTWAQDANKPDLTQQPTLYAVGYAHLDTEWRWEYPQVIDEYLRHTITSVVIELSHHTLGRRWS